MHKKQPCYFTMWLVAALLLVTPPWPWASEIAPRIGDQEIIESLAELNAGQKALQARMTKSPCVSRPTTGIS